MTSLEEGEDWSWCFEDEVTLRREPDGTWHDVDPFFESGLWFAQRLAAETGVVEAAPDAVTEEGFPIGEWLTEYRGRREHGTLQAELVEALEALPGWRW